MKFTGFASGCIGKALTVILCIILGMVLAVGGIALTGYLVLNKEGMMGTISDKTEGTDFKLEFNDTVKEMSILQWGTELMAKLSDMSAINIGEMESLIGLTIISDTIEDVIGVDASIIRNSTLDNLGSTVSNNLTILNAQDKFGIQFPDMPVFQDAGFLASPLASAFGEFDSYKLGDVITIDGNSNTVLQELKDVAIKDIGGATTDDTIKSMLLCQLMNIGDESNMTLKALKYSCIESQYEVDENGEFVLDESGNKVYKTKEITETVDGTEVKKTVPLRGINETIDGLYVKDVVEITENGAVVLRKMRTPTQEEIDQGKANLFGTEDLLVKDLGGSKVSDIIDATTIGELIEIHEEDGPNGEYEKSEPILIALKDVNIAGLNGKISTLRLDEIFERDSLNSGALSLIPPDTVLSGIPAAMTSAMTNSTTATLVGKGLIGEDKMTNIHQMPHEQQAFIYNSDMGTMLAGIIDFIADPITVNEMLPSVNYYHIAPEEKTIATSTFNSLTDFVAAYKQYDSIMLASSVTIDIDVITDAQYYNEELGCYLIPMFNLKSATVITVNDGTAKLAVYTEEGMLNRNQYGYAYAVAGATLLEMGYDTLIGVSVQSATP